VKHVVVIGGGVGGLTAATRLAVLGHRVQLLEARSDVGGLASEVSAGGLAFDGGPYILLDKPGLEWAFERINADIATLDLRPVSHLYELQGNGRPTVRIFLDLQRTVAELEQEWPGAGRAYERLVLEMDAWRRTLAPLLLVSRPSVLELARRGALGAAPFLLRSLGSVLGRSGLPREVVDAIAIWTHIAGQTVRDAASVMAFVPGADSSCRRVRPARQDACHSTVVVPASDRSRRRSTMRRARAPHPLRSWSRHGRRRGRERPDRLRRRGVELSRRRHLRRARGRDARSCSPATACTATAIAGHVCVYRNRGAVSRTPISVSDSMRTAR
jgi:glycine/D-amino acid oxidase-like deaminating enzyme